MSKELKAPDKVTQKMTRDGAVAENLTTAKQRVSAKDRRRKTIQPPQREQRKKATQRIAQRLAAI